MSDLGYRARKVLYALVTEYIASGEPVGSRTLARRYGLNLSPASIRNVLADLEEAGYLTQPHTSAGRVPTDRGFRLFVDGLMQMREITAEDRDAVIGRMRALRPGVDDIMREAGKVLSSLTGAAAVVLPPKAEQDVLAHLRFMALRPGAVLAVLVMRSGSVQNRIVQVARDLEADELERVHNYLAELVVGRTLDQVRRELATEMANERGRYKELRRRVKEMLDAMSEQEGPAMDVVIEGQRLLIDRPEFADVDKIRGLVHAFEEKERLLELLDRTLVASGVQILIGSETNLTGVTDLSVVSSSYQSGSATGSVGVIGPTRMDYAKVVPIVGFTAKAIADVLDGRDPEDHGPETDTDDHRGRGGAA